MGFWSWLFGESKPKKREWLEPKYRPGMTEEEIKRERAKEYQAANRDLEDAVIEDEKAKKKKIDPLQNKM